jgi:hypothetical protein
MFVLLPYVAATIAVSDNDWHGPVLGARMADRNETLPDFFARLAQIIRCYRSQRRLTGFDGANFLP